jgi:hypothetical protein
MTVEGAVRVVAGLVVLFSVATAHPQCPLFISTHMLWFATFVGVMLVQSAFTGFCPSAWVFRKLGLKDARGPSTAPQA